MTVPDLNYGDFFDALAVAIPDRSVIIHGDQPTDWRTFDARSNRLARTLLAHGLDTGAKVAFYLRNSPAYVELFAACAKARLTHANVNYLYVEEELFYILDNADAQAVVYDAEFAPQIESLKARLPKVRLYLELGTPPSSPWALDYEDACTSGDAAPLDIQRSGSDLYFMYTGGTTGYPKAVMWEHKHRIAVIGMTEFADVERHVAQVANSSGSVVLPACPLMHSTGFTSTLSALMSGSCIVLPRSRGFDAQRCLEAIERHRVTRLAIVGDAFSVPLLDHLAQGQTYDLTRVELISSAGAMWSGERKAALLEYFPNATLSDSLGSSEGSRLGSRITTRGENTTTAHFQIGPDVKVFTEDGREVQPGSGEAGLIATTGSIPLGYYKDEARTAATFPTINGVRYSMAGDWCTVEEDGSMVLLGRGNNCINSGGEKIYPEEVEEALKLHPAVFDAAVLGKPDARWGQAVTAVVRCRDHQNVSAEALKDHLSNRLARYKHPKEYLFVDTHLRHDNGKVNYRAVRGIVGIE